MLPDRLPGAPRQGALQLVEALEPIVHLSSRMNPHQPLRGLGQLVAFIFYASPDKSGQPLAYISEKPTTGKHAFSDNFCGGAGRRRAKVRDEIADGKIDFMTYG